MEFGSFTYDGKVPNPQWAVYFTEDDLGKTFRTLVTDDGQLVMSDSSVEHRTYEGLYHAAKGDVLMIGLGLNVHNDAIAALPAVNRCVTFEKYQSVIDANTVKHEVVHQDGLLLNSDHKNKFDLVWWDAWGLPDVDILRAYAKPQGRIMVWPSD